MPDAHDLRQRSADPATVISHPAAAKRVLELGEITAEQGPIGTEDAGAHLRFGAREK
jgi:hypothetical protein